MMTIRLVLFDALHTLVTPRAPIFIQYAHVFEPHLGELNPDAIKYSFKIGNTRLTSGILSVSQNEPFVGIHTRDRKL